MCNLASSKDSVIKYLDGYFFTFSRYRISTHILNTCNINYMVKQANKNLKNILPAPLWPMIFNMLHHLEINVWSELTTKSKLSQG